jgi:TM2 domain-containing membrane protein YozV
MKLYNNNITFGNNDDTNIGTQTAGNENGGVINSDKSWNTTLVLAIFLGPFGAHRFYVGKTGTAVLMIFLSLPTLFIWPLIDIIMIATGGFKDAQGRLVTEKTWQN